MGKGIYCLVISGGGVPVQIGALGERFFPEGYYVYAGSALGSGGLQARVGRHIRVAATPGSRTHWHIDHLLHDPSFRLAGVYCAETGERKECSLAGALGGGKVHWFGSSDCRCPSHLFFFAAHPGPEIRRAFRELGLAWTERTL
ncbi:Uri superfamily endonuclease [Methanolinea mesophila]|uniref:GIY-YIG nuclease family protein n=1 Tax=Methanolinea mesophila TaxID=547055 RepID=UPI001AE787B8|nr:DUF123 domain-containing protein [Methanolinea mesophila]MBP1928824.1 Uri superfamily endonuclease [Methanolinea mesophila]